MTDAPCPRHSPPEARLLCCGGLRVDYIITVQGEARLMEMGGNALYAAAGARVWLDRIAILARIGENYPPEWLGRLRQSGFDVRGIRPIPGAQDHRTFYAYLDENTRVDTDPAAHFARIGQVLPDDLRDYAHSTPGQDDPHRYEPLAVTPEDLESYFAACHDAPEASRSDGGVPIGLHMAPISIRTQRYLPKTARQHGVSIVSADPGERAMRPALMSYVEEMLAQIDIFLPSDQEVKCLLCDAKMQTDARRCAIWFADRGPRIVVLKLGAKGALVHERDTGRFWHVPALPVRVVDATGAGDAFCGGFMASFIQHSDPLRAAIAGTVSASFAVQDYGPRAILDATENEVNRRAAWVRENTYAA